MQLGVVFPTRQIGTDPSVIAEYARTAESSGYGHLLTYDHVLGVDRGPDWNGPYDYTDQFHEPLTLFSYLAGVTTDISFLTGILILPQRQTVLVAKQAAEVDVLSEGRLQVGVGTGWNRVEYEALGREFGTRGKRVDEQIDLLRELWQDELVSWDGDAEADVTFRDAGLNPLPVQRPIPVWIGGGADVVLRRAARLGKGWIIPGKPLKPGASLADEAAKLETLKAYLDKEGRNPDEFSVLGRLRLSPDDPDEWVAGARKWADLGITHLAVDTMDIDIDDPSQHATKIGRFVDAIVDSNVAVDLA